MFWIVSGVVKLDCAVKAPVSLEAQHADVVSYSLAAVKKKVYGAVVYVRVQRCGRNKHEEKAIALFL